jgi:hypothetical protein
VSRSLTSWKILTTLMFVFRYMAPEVILACPGGKPYGRKVDVFSFSMILWELATLEKAMSYLDDGLPDSDGGHRGIIRIVAGKRPPLARVLEGYGDKMAALIDECWDHDDKKRPTFTIIKVKHENCSLLENHLRKCIFSTE